MFASRAARISLAVSGLIIVSLAFTGCRERGPRTVAVPDVTGKSLTDAATEIMEAGLYVDTPSEQSSSSVEAGYVIQQTPVAGTPVLPESIVSLVVSTGPMTPDLTEPAATDGQMDTTAEGNPNETVAAPD